MLIRDSKSIIIILMYALINSAIFWFAYHQKSQAINDPKKAVSLAPEFTEIEELEYFHLKNGLPQMSLSADRTKSLGEEVAEFTAPRGIYNYQQKNKTLNYQALEAEYKKAKEVLTLKGDVKVSSEGNKYTSQKIKYFMKKDLISASGGVDFKGEDPKSRDELEIHSETMKANPQAQLSHFKGGVTGSMQRKKKFEGKMTFSSTEMVMEGGKSLAHLIGNVVMKRDNYVITSGKADITLENYNKSLKYFVLNDDVRVTENLHTPQGITQRKAFAERLEGFGREQKMVLSGAPRVETGSDVIKGYKIIIREDIDLVEIDDSMSDVQMKRKKTKD